NPAQSTATPTRLTISCFMAAILLHRGLAAVAARRGAGAIIARMKTNRRSFLRMTGALGATALVLNDTSIELVAQSARALGTRTAEDVASDESFWRDVQSAFSLDRSLINLNNGNSCPSPTVVHEAYKRY